MATSWSGVAEWEEVYSLLFSLDDAAARFAGVERVQLWRERGKNLPVSVDATATFIELSLLNDGCMATQPSEHMRSLMYAMAITRLVNGIVDPLQQAARASSVKRLAQSVGLPTSLVELRHECTHNKLPSLGRMRLAADQALLWLHTHYWLPQRALRDQGAESLHSCLREYRNATAARCAQGEPPLRKHVVACALALERSLQPTQLSTHLIPALLDDGFLAPSPAADEGDVAFSSWEATRDVWAPVLARLGRLWPKYGFCGALLLGILCRLNYEAQLGPPPGASTASRGAARLVALHGWSTHLLETEGGGGGGSGGGGAGGSSGGAGGGGAGLAGPIEPSVLTQTAWLGVRTANGWGRSAVQRATRHPAWPSPELGAAAKRLMHLQEMALKIQRGESVDVDALGGASSAAASAQKAMDVDGESGGQGGGAGGEGERVASTVESAAQLMGQVAACLAPALGAGSAWRVCAHWAPTAIGAPPPSSALAAMNAAVLSTGVGWATDEELEEPLPAGTGDGMQGDGKGSAAMEGTTITSSATSDPQPTRQPSLEERLDASAAAATMSEPDEPMVLRILYRRKAAAVERAASTGVAGAAHEGGKERQRTAAAPPAKKVAMAAAKSLSGEGKSGASGGRKKKRRS